MSETIEQLLTPRFVDVNTVDGTRSKVVIEPLERGFGYTLGNALRRILYLASRVLQSPMLKLTVCYTSIRLSKAFKKMSWIFF
jgi:hypothetical protein